MKKKGFTLIELIVVIAIIGVLAAILVPAMLGYVKKSKITTANTTAKSIYNAFNSSLTDMDSEDYKIKSLGSTPNTYSSQSGSAWTSQTISDTVKTNAKAGTFANGLDTMLKNKVNTYFSDIEKVTEFGVTLSSGGACIAAATLNGAYPGGYPNALTVDLFNEQNGDVTLAEALKYAKDKAFS